MFFQHKDWPWPFDNAVQASVFCELLDQEDIPYKTVRHGEALWGFAEQVSEGWGHVEVPEEYQEKVEELFQAFLVSEAGDPDAS